MYLKRGHPLQNRVQKKQHQIDPGLSWIMMLIAHCFPLMPFLNICPNKGFQKKTRKWNQDCPGSRCVVFFPPTSLNVHDNFRIRGSKQNNIKELNRIRIVLVLDHYVIWFVFPFNIPICPCFQCVSFFGVAV